MTAPAAAPVTPPVVDPKRQPAVEQGTEYVILRATQKSTVGASDLRDGWQWVGTRTSRDNATALRAFLADAKAGDQIDGTYLSIPARAYKPIKITQETVTTLKLEEAK